MSTWFPPHPQPIWWNLKRRKAWSCYINPTSWNIAQQCRCQAECFPVAVEWKVVTMSMTGYGPSCMTMQLLSRPQLSTQENVLIQIGALYKTCTWPIEHLSSVYLSFWPHASLWAWSPIAHLFAQIVNLRFIFRGFNTRQCRKMRGKFWGGRFFAFVFFQSVATLRMQ